MSAQMEDDKMKNPIDELQEIAQQQYSETYHDFQYNVYENPERRMYIVQIFTREESGKFGTEVPISADELHLDKEIARLKIQHLFTKLDRDILIDEATEVPEGAEFPRLSG